MRPSPPYPPTPTAASPALRVRAQAPRARAAARPPRPAAAVPARVHRLLRVLGLEHPAVGAKGADGQVILRGGRGRRRGAGGDRQESSLHRPMPPLPPPSSPLCLCPTWPPLLAGPPWREGRARERMITGRSRGVRVGGGAASCAAVGRGVREPAIECTGREGGASWRLGGRGWHSLHRLPPSSPAAAPPPPASGGRPPNATAATAAAAAASGAQHAGGLATPVPRVHQQQQHE